jgi:hypothetical protein
VGIALLEVCEIKQMKMNKDGIGSLLLHGLMDRCRHLLMSISAAQPSCTYAALSIKARTLHYYPLDFAMEHITISHASYNDTCNTASDNMITRRVAHPIRVP